MVFEVDGSEPIRPQKLRPGVRLARVVLQIGGSGGLHREVPVGDGHHGVHEPQAVLKGVGDERVTHQEAHSVVELEGPGAGAAGRKRDEGQWEVREWPGRGRAGAVVYGLPFSPYFPGCLPCSTNCTLHRRHGSLVDPLFSKTPMVR